MRFKSNWPLWLFLAIIFVGDAVFREGLGYIMAILGTLGILACGAYAYLNSKGKLY
jgi:hypothetical protein